MIHQENVVYVYNKNKELLAVFDGNSETVNPESGRNLMVNPQIKLESNGESSFSFSMMACSEKWHQIKHPENLYCVNNRWYTPLNENSYNYTGDGNARIVNVTCVELWYLLSTKYKQVYNTNLVTYARASFIGWSGTNAMFRVNSSGCSNPGNTISTANAWNQVKLWAAKDKKGNSLTYNILKTKEYAPTGWEDAPTSLAMSSISVSGNTATLYMTARASQEIQQNYDYQQGGTYQVESRPYPPTIKEVWVNSTITTDTTTGNQTKRRIVTSNKRTNYSYNSNTGRFSVNYYPASNEEINYVIGVYDYYDMGELKTGATATFSWGAEVVDEHTFLVLPKADTKYKLTIDGVEYEDSQVRDSRGVIMPRGSAGYAMWAALKSTGWQLGICDVIAKEFNPSIDYGVFNCESDMKDVLYNIQMIQELYGGILDWDSENKILNYRAENSEDYTTYNDGFNDWTGYEFREGKNIKDQPSIVCDNNLITKGYVLGYGNLNIKRVNGGKSYVTDYSYTTDTYEGYLEQPLIYDTNDEGGQRQLLYWGQKEIKKKSRPRQTISYNCVDIRTVEGYEHEVFDINDVCRAYWRDKETGEEKFELKRVIKWEYNPFALWDSQVELGDKTANFSEIFKLIYNSAVEEAPKTNAMGKISSDEIVMEVDIAEFGFDDLDIGDYEYPNYSYTGGVGGYGGYGYGSTLSDYISLIARKTTENSDAVAGLILEATDLYAQAELFASYQKRTDDLISDTYSGLRLYADEMGSELDAKVTGVYEYTEKGLKDVTVNINGVDQKVKNLQITTDAGFKAQQNINESVTQQFSNYSAKMTTMSSQIESNSSAIIQTSTDLTQAKIDIAADYNQKISSLSGKLDQEISSRAQFEATANSTFATTTQLSQYATTSYVDGQVSKKVSLSEVKTYADQNYAKATIASTVNNIGSTLVVSNSSAYLYAGYGAYKSGSYIYLTGSSISIVSSGSIILQGTSVKVNGKIIS